MASLSETERAYFRDRPMMMHHKGGDDGWDGHHPFIAGLLQYLPPEGTDWPTPDRVKWLKAAAMLFDFIYTSGDTGRPLQIEVSSDSAGGPVDGERPQASADP